MTSTVHWTATTGEDWEHGLVSGNGVLGALLYGIPARHEITVAHERVVLPTDPPRIAPLLAPDLERFRALIDEGRAQDVADLGVARSVEQGYPGLQWTDPLVPSVTVAIETDDEGAADYRRETDLDRDLVTISWRVAEGERRIELFTSRADDVVVVRLDPGLAAARVSAAGPENVVTTSSGVKGGNAERVEFTVGDDEHGRLVAQRFRADWPVDVIGADAHVRTVADGTARTILIDVAPRYDGDEAAIAERARRLDVLPHDFDTLHARHLAALAAEVHVARLDLGGDLGIRPTEEMLAAEDAGDRDALIAVQYLSAQRLIAGSTGELPPTLQGVWSGTFDPAWSSDYTMNGNVQNGSIASMLSTGNPAQLRTYLDMLEGFADDFRENAAQLFGAEGYVLPSRCSPTHAKCTHFDARHAHEFWTAGGAWAALFAFDHAWYTADLEHLRAHAYPFAREVERFYESFLVDGPAGRFVFSPSYSPENRSPSFDSQVCRNATMDRAALAGMLRGLRRASALLGVDEDLDARRADWLRRLPDYRVAPDGTLAEWLDDGVEERLGHRTASQLLGTWFEPDGDLVARMREPIRALIAAKLAWRASGGSREEMAYGLVQLGVAAAAVGDADLALECVDRMSRLYFLPTLATTHDVGAIFNVDIAGGFPAVINAMLVGSSVGSIDLLPALPSRWGSGAVREVSARGGVVIEELSWTPTAIRARLRTLPGARALRGGRPLAIGVPEGWTSSAAAVDPGDGAVFEIEVVR
ncbi:glycosyl hydrolase family 95 catalytic domain-containing protein [Microbacterium sp. NPDC089695]|uniref:glycosyl hydrolase family 95 catalytic domain-containing protein n=1 Tax=Microbacterium sp. NPDC089695 TaxID=3364198 RepID=UPI00382AD2C6